MPSIQGLSKKAANYRPAQTPSARCQECKYMWPKLSVGGCRYVRGAIHADDVCNEFAPERPRPDRRFLRPTEQQRDLQRTAVRRWRRRQDVVEVLSEEIE